MSKELLMEIHIHKMDSGKKYRLSLTDGSAILQEVIVTSIKSRDELVWRWCDLYSTVDVIMHEDKAKEFKFSEIPSIPVLDESEAVDFFEDNENYVYSRVIQAVSEGVQAKLSEIRLFEISGTDVYITSKKESWKAGLHNALSYYEQAENYERCNQVARLIEQL